MSIVHFSPTQAFSKRSQCPCPFLRPVFNVHCPFSQNPNLCPVSRITPSTPLHETRRIQYEHPKLPDCSCSRPVDDPTERVVTKITIPQNELYHDPHVLPRNRHMWNAASAGL